MIWPLFIVIPIFIKYYSIKVQYIKDYTGRQSVIIINEYDNNILWQITSYIHCITLTINGIMTIILIRLLKIELKKIIDTNNCYKVDISMTKYAIIYFILFGFVVIVEIPMTIASNLEFYDIANDLLTLTVLCQSLIVFYPSYGLLILCKDIRITFFEFIGLKKNDTISHILHQKKNTSRKRSQLVK
ncbi:7TM GPCR, serpentine receptor class g (Srg) family-containing protein [Strongyloides ratti]|uniref:Serpentine receptor class gamma n=1 Tax=Strongyloides ratti TaxID=34506 RepID=A0A090LJD9_STRRB|nr:7TM GPCR, serpentine receptor class g (Srg) family-containing protein [Strongyloides ratti]CEF69823.1 7TM GPCR, serpentine receptor class g (Srg) family-containing protein [Strongyloides ratti]